MSNVKDIDLLNEEEGLDEGVKSYSMKRFFPTPEDLAEMEFGEYIKVLNRALDVELANAPFIFITNFKFKDEEAPFLFIGPLPAAWKKAIMARYKNLNEYARGVCSLDSSSTPAMLELTVKSGKGQRERNLRSLNKDLFRKAKGRPEVKFSEGTAPDQDDDSAEGLLAQAVQQEIDKLDQKEAKVKTGLIAQTHSLVGRIQQAMESLKALPKEDHSALIEKAKDIQLLIQEWYILYRGNMSERQPEKAYVDKIKQHIEQHILQSKAFKTLEIKEFSDEWKNCMHQYQEIQALDVNDEEQLLIRDQEFQDLYQSLTFLQLQIRTWAVDNRESYKEHLKFFQELEQRILGLLQKMLADAPELKSLDKARAEVVDFEKRWRELEPQVKGLCQLAKKGPLNQVEGEALNSLYEKLLVLHQDSLTWLEGNAGEKNKKLKNMRQIRDEVRSAMDDLRETGALSPEMNLDDAELLEFGKRFQALRSEVPKLGSAMQSAINTIKKPGESPEEVQKAKIAYRQGVDKVMAYCAQINDLRFDLRQWAKIRDLSQNDQKRRDELFKGMGILFDNLEALLSKNDKERLYAKQGFDPKALSNLAESTQLPVLPTVSQLMNSSAYNAIKRLHAKYTQLSGDDLESRRLCLLEMGTKIQDWFDNHNNDKERPNVEMLKGLVFNHLKRLSYFGTQRDNYIEIIDLHEQFRKNATDPKALLNQPQDIQDLQSLIKEIEEEIQTWQNLHLNLSGFGTRAQNKKLERIRNEIRNFVAELSKAYQVQQAKQTGGDLAQQITDRSELVKALALAALQASTQDQPVNRLQQAKALLNSLVKANALNDTERDQAFEALNNLLDKTKSANVTVNDENLQKVKDWQDKLKQATEKPPLEFNSVSNALQTKEAYDNSKDKVYAKLISLKDEISKLKGNLSGRNLRGKVKAQFLDKMEAFATKHKLWEAVMESYVQDQAWIDAKKIINDFVNSEAYQEDLKIIEGIEGIRDTRQEVKATKDYSKNIQARIEHLKKLESKPMRPEQKKQLREKQFAANNLQVSQIAQFGELATQYEEAFQKLDPKLQTTSHKVKEHSKMTTGLQNKALELAKAYPDTQDRIDAKTQAYEALQRLFNTYLQKAENQRQLSDIDALEEAILTWNEKLIITKNEDLTKTLQAQAQGAKRIQDLLKTERLRLQDPKLSKSLPDAFFEQIEKQCQALKLQNLLQNGLPQDDDTVLERLSFVFSSINRWKAQRSPLQIENHDRLEQIKVWEGQLASIMSKGQVVNKAAKLRWTQACEAWRKQIAGFEKRPQLNEGQTQHIQTWKQALEDKIKNHPRVKNDPEPQIQRLQAWMEEQEWGFWELDFLAHRKEEQLILNVFEGYDVYSDLSNLDEIIEPEDRQEIERAIKAALERAQKALSLSQYDKAERILSHIPVAFWPDEVLEDMRLWQKMQTQFFGPTESQLDKFDAKDVDQFVNRTLDLGKQEEQNNPWGEIKDDLSDLFDMDDIKDDWDDLEKLLKDKLDIDLKALISGTLDKGVQKVEQAIAQVMDQILRAGIEKNLSEDFAKLIPKNILEKAVVQQHQQNQASLLKDLFKETEDSKAVTETLGKVLDGIGFGLSVTGELASSVGEFAEVIRQWTDVKKLDSLDPERRKAITKGALMTTNLAVKQANKLAKLGEKAIDTFVDEAAQELPGVKAASAVLKGLTLLFDTGSKALEHGVENPSMADFINKDNVKEVIEGIVDAVISVGGGVGDIIEIFLPAGSIVSASFKLAGDLKSLVKSAIAVHKARVQLNNTQGVLTRAVQQDSIMLPAMRRQMKTAKQKVAKASIDLAGDSVKVIGSTTSLVGACVSLAPEPEVQAAAIGVKIVGTIIQKVGDGIKIAGKIVFTAIDEGEKIRTQKLLKLAKKDRNVRLQVIENSKVYAKMALAIGLMEEDPIAVEYCIVRGFTEDDLDETNAKVILQKLLDLDEESSDETPTLDKAKKSLGEVKGYFQRISELGKLGQVNQSSVQSLRQDMRRIEQIVLSGKTHVKVLGGLSTVGDFLLDIITGLPLSPATEALQNYVSEIKGQFRQIHSDLGLGIDRLYQRVDDLSTSIRNKNQALLGNWVSDTASEIFDLENQIQVERELLQGLSQARQQLRRHLSQDFK